MKHTIYSLALSLLLFSTLLAQPVAIPSTTPKRPDHPITTHERFVTFIADKGFAAELLLHNNRLDVPVTAKPALILGDTEIPLAPVTLAPHMSRHGES